MGIASSTESKFESSTESKFASSTESDSRYHLNILDILEDVEEFRPDDNPEEMVVGLFAMAEATRDMYMKELHALFPPKLGESSTDRPKEVDTERDEVIKRFSDFMKGGSCKESFKALEDCMESTQSISKCKEHLPILKKCMDAHIGYYEPILALAKATEEKMIEEIEAIMDEQEQQKLVAGKNQPER